MYKNRSLCSRALIVSGVLVGSSLVAVATAGVASASCSPPDGVHVLYQIRDAHEALYPTNVASAWVWPRYTAMHMEYSSTKEEEADASVTATVSADESFVFASASESLGVTVGASYSRTQEWSYSADAPLDPAHEYRLHLYHQSYTFQAMKLVFSPSTCRYANSWSAWQTVSHAPVASSSDVWTTDREAA